MKREGETMTERRDGASCGSCAFFVRVRGASGECRRRAPVLLDRSNRVAKWPAVRDGEWCGEYRREPQS